MARLPRAIAVGAAHHITQRGVNREQIFFRDADRRTYLDCLTPCCEQARVRILAYCLMSNHVHIVAIPEEQESLAVALRRAHSRYAMYINARRQRTGHLWQNRFHSCALDEKHLWVALRYVERNPVRAQLVERPEQYRWSSAAAHLGHRRALPLLDLSFYAKAGGVESWTALLAEPEELISIRALQRGTFTGRPVGSPEFIEQMEQDLGRRLAPQRKKVQRLTSTNVSS